MFNVGDRVHILEPFAPFFPGELVVSAVNEASHYINVEGIESAFDFSYVEVL